MAYSIDIGGHETSGHGVDVNSGINVGGGGFHPGTGGSIDVSFYDDQAGGSSGGGGSSGATASYGGGGGQVYYGGGAAGGGGGGYSGPSLAEQQAAAAAAAEAARIAAERARNEKLTREKDAKVAQQARESQANRRQEQGTRPANLIAQAQARTQQQRTQGRQGVTPSVRPLAAQEVVAGMDDSLESQPATQAESLGFVDTETGELVDTTPERASVPATAVEPGKPGRPKGPGKPAKSKMAAAMSSTSYSSTRPSRGASKAASTGGAIRVSPRDVIASIDEYSDRKRDAAELTDLLDEMSVAEREDELEAQAAGSSGGSGGNGGNDALTGQSEEPSDDSERFDPWNMTTDVTGIKGSESILKAIRDRAGELVSNAMSRMSEGSPLKDANFDAQRRGEGREIDLDVWETSQNQEKRDREARDSILRRYLNSTLLRIQSEHVETEKRKVDGRERTFAGIRYSDEVEAFIGNVSSLYGGCSVGDVMRLVQLRAGLGVDSRGKIGNVSADEFKLSDLQFCELCRDIITSQNEHGHPFGVVDGVPGAHGIRDDSGRYVVVAGTRCFPLGYMPRDLALRLSSIPNSALRGRSVGDIQRMIGESWINETYPELLANTGGNLISQAYAIENMMRGLMMADGVNPADLDIPEAAYRRTIMAMRAERNMVANADVAEANRVKHREQERRFNRWVHRQFKSNGTRGPNGRIESPGTRRRNRLGDSLRNVSNTQRRAGALSIPIMLSAVPEAIQANFEQGFYNLSSGVIRNALHGRDVRGYEYTPELDAMARSDAGIEAMSVLESLYNAGGFDLIDLFRQGMDPEHHDDRGHAKYQYTKADLMRFLTDWGFVGDNPTISQAILSRLGLKPGDEAGLLSRMQNVADSIEGAVMGAGSMSSQMHASQFVRMCMAEMANSSIHNMRTLRRDGKGEFREAFTADQVADWGKGYNGVGEMFGSLLDTDAGREAFMTQGVTSLGRKSMFERAIREVMAKNGVTEFLVRNMLDRFPEYGMNKVMRQLPMFNTISFLMSRGIDHMGASMVRNTEGSELGQEIGETMRRAAGYQMGSRLSFKEGFRKNLAYDVIMAGNKVAVAFVIKGVISMLGGIYPPDNDRDRYSMWEWKVGRDQGSAMPVKFAWWMDDLSGVSVPLGYALAICEAGDWSSESITDATNVFIDGVASFNDGVALMDAIDLVNNFDKHLDAFLGKDVPGFKGYDTEWGLAMLERNVWTLLGSQTPAFVGQVLPWSKDFLFHSGPVDAHTSSKVYDIGEGSKYDKETAQREYRTKQTTDLGYAETSRRRIAESNDLAAIILDIGNWLSGKSDVTTSYRYGLMPLDTMADAYAQKKIEENKIDFDKLPKDADERKAEAYKQAEVICQTVSRDYKTADEANADGFVLDPETRVTCISYCHHMIKQAKQKFNEAKSNGWLPNDEYNRINQEKEDTIEKYNNLLYEFFDYKSKIPWRVPRYVRQESERASRYVDAEGNPTTVLDSLTPGQKNVVRGAIAPMLDLALRPLIPGADVTGSIGDERASRETYWYGNQASLLPASSPRRDGKGYDYETIPYWVQRDKDGNQVNDTTGIYDELGTMSPLSMGRNAGKNLQEMYYGGQGNIRDDIPGEQRIARDGTPTLGWDGRPYRIMDETVPDNLKDMDDAKATKMLGFDSDIPTDEEKATEKAEAAAEKAAKAAAKSGSGGSYYRRSGGGGGYARSYSYGGGGGGYYTYGGSSQYNPKIYSNAKQVYSTRASGMQTHQPYKATSTYLRPNFYTKGSREAYKRSDI